MVAIPKLRAEVLRQTAGSRAKDIATLVNGVLAGMSTARDASGDENPSESEAEEEGGSNPEEATALAADLGVHESHLDTTRGIWTWCRACGAHTSGQRLRMLRQPCGELKVAGRTALRRVGKGLPPAYGEDDWGDRVGA